MFLLVKVLVCTIFDVPVILELVQLLVGLWVSFATFNFSFMLKNPDFWGVFLNGLQ